MAWYTYIAGFVTALAATPIVIGLASWFGKLWAARILEKDRARYSEQMATVVADLRTRDSKELLVHQLQFQKEFEVYKELWGAALRMARAGSKLRPIQFDATAPYDELREEVKASHTFLRDTVYRNRPFYAPLVYETAKTMLDKFHSTVEMKNLLVGAEMSNADGEGARETRKDMSVAIRKGLDEVNQLVDPLCHAIRARVWSTNSSAWDRPQDPPE